MKTLILIGYSGHALVVADVLLASGREVYGYFEQERKALDPFDLEYLGQDTIATLQSLSDNTELFVAIGNNNIRRKVTERLLTCGCKLAAPALHPSAAVSSLTSVAAGVLLAPSVTVNALAEIATGVILNTSCTVEHECFVGSYAHIAPGAILAGNVRVEEGAFIGANAVVKQGVCIGEWSTVGAGAVVLQDVPPRTTVVGNPARELRS
ncbi:acetyltransferase [Neolewinella litorea]|uniref:Acetyltransferase n=1 Tax=Neolewinella litorea TaxID=2562452 RepID=A0A4S4N914_9BACT|nr:acetyltransferase [Neolewinella litorea]THH34558.1 acetyltransferase [Neolewinella litorea]